jgi:hypothetical protein
VRVVVHPIRSAIATAGADDGLAFTYQGRQVRDAALLRVALWNEGPGPVRASQILTPVTLSLPPNCEILRAVTKLQTREVVRLSTEVARSPGAPDRVVLNWNIIEDGDGAVIEMLFSGPIDSPLSVHGVLEGQPRVALGPSMFPLESQQEQYENSRRIPYFVAILTGVILVFMIPHMLSEVRRDWRDPSNRRRIYWWIGNVIRLGAVLVAVLTLWYGIEKIRYLTPFEF